MSMLIKKMPQLGNDSLKSNFPCNQCGWCCQNLHNHDIYKDLDSGNGTCIHFNKFNYSCNIYNDRPLVCNIESMYHAMFSTIDYDDYISLNIKACQSAQIENKLSVIQI